MHAACTIGLSINEYLNVGIHALINVHEYHCIVIRMRCWLLDDYCYCLEGVAPRSDWLASLRGLVTTSHD